MNVPILGIVENMSYVKCPDCGKELHIFGNGKSEGVAEELGLPLLAKIPLDSELASLADAGKFERFAADYMVGAADCIENLM